MLSTIIQPLRRALPPKLAADTQHVLFIHIHIPCATEFCPSSEEAQTVNIDDCVFVFLVPTPMAACILLLWYQTPYLMMSISFSSPTQAKHSCFLSRTDGVSILFSVSHRLEALVKEQKHMIGRKPYIPRYPSPTQLDSASGNAVM